VDVTLLDLQQAAALLRGTAHFIRGLIASGDLRYVKIGKKFCVTRGDLDRWVETNRQLRTETDDFGENSGKGRAIAAKRLRSVG